MLDVARAAALVCTLWLACRARAWSSAAIVSLTAYVFVLEVASGFAFQSQEAIVPAAVRWVALLGPSGMPRGDLPAFPLAALLVQWPGLTNVLTAGLLLWDRRRVVADLRARIGGARAGAPLPLRRLATALALLAAVTAVCAFARQLPLAFGERIPEE